MMKHKSIIVTFAINLGLLAYLIAIILAFFKFYGPVDERLLYDYYQFNITNDVIDSHSSLDSENKFVYTTTSKEGNVETITFFSNGNDNSIGTYDPQSYIFGTENNVLYISFITEAIPCSIVRFNEVKVCDSSGVNVKTLSKDDYSVNKFTLTYKTNTPKYIYSVSLTYLIKK